MRRPRLELARIKAAIRLWHSRGHTDREIGAAIGEDRRRVVNLRRHMGLRPHLDPNRSVYTFAQRRFVTINYGKMPTAQIARVMGKSVGSVYRAAERFGLSEKNPHHGRNAKFVAFVRDCHAKGWSDAETAAAWGCERHTAERARNRLGLPHNAYSEHRRRRVAEKTQQQLRKAGLPSIGHLRVEAFKKYARDHGWPEDLKPRQVQILELLWVNGPMTRENIGQALGMKLKKRPDGRYWYAMMCNNPQGQASTSYTGDLLRRGLIISLGRIVKNKPQGARNMQGHNTCLYSLPLTIERKVHDPKQC